MKPVDRFIAALNLEEADQVPLAEFWFDDDMVFRILGREYKGDLYDLVISDRTKRLRIIKDLVEARYLCFKKLGISNMPAVYSFLQSRSRELPDGNSINEWAHIYKVSSTGRSYLASGALKTDEAVKSFIFPDPEAPDRLDELEVVIRLAKGELSIVGCVLGLIHFTWPMVGMEKFAVWIHRKPELIERLMDGMLRYDMEIGKKFIDAGADVVLVDDDCAYKSGPMISPELYKKLVFPRLKMMVSTFKKKVPVILHTDGNICPILDYIVGSGIDGLHPLEPQAGMDIAFVKQKYEKLCVIGNVDVSHTLPLGTLEEVEREVKEKIETLAPGGRYMLASSNSISNQIPIQNVMALYGCGRKFGKYPRRHDQVS